MLKCGYYTTVTRDSLYYKLKGGKVASMSKKTVIAFFSIGNPSTKTKQEKREKIQCFLFVLDKNSKISYSRYRDFSTFSISCKNPVD